MRDVFPEAARAYQAWEARAREFFARYGFGEIRTPLVEYTVLFERGVGQGTDIVNKEMFYVPSKDQDEEEGGERDRKMVLRPEATASVVRAYVEQEVDKTAPGVQRYFYMGPMFRYERPQRGRLRQFTQIGIETLGSASPAADAEAVILLHDLLSAAGLPGLTYLFNAVGCPACRPGYIRKLQEYARARTNPLCEDCRQRLEKNPLRLFDCKVDACRAVMAGAPLVQDALCSECRDHQRRVLGLLETSGVETQIEPRLMRGLDYYTRTVFEVVAEGLGAQNAVAAGGRYDHLVEELEGPPTPAVGWSLGIERLLELAPAQEPATAGPDIFIVAAGPDPDRLFYHVTALRRLGLRIGLEYEARSPKALLKKADRLGARFALFVSQTDPETIELKNLRTGKQFPARWDMLDQVVRETG